jgi:hypothetical protein
MDIRTYSSASNLTPLERVVTDSIGTKSTPHIVKTLDLEMVEGLTDIARANVRIARNDLKGGASTGSGFLITEDGLIVTNKHVIFPSFLMQETKEKALQYLNFEAFEIKVNILKEPEENPGIVLANADGSINTGEDPVYETFTADIVDFDENYDLALLKLRTEPGVKLKISETRPDAGDDSYSLSYMHGTTNPIVTWGQVLTAEQRNSEVAELNKRNSSYKLDNEDALVTDNSMDHGSSGSPIMDKDASINAVHTWGIKRLPKQTRFDPYRYRKNNGENAISINSQRLLDFLDRAGISSEKLSDGKISAHQFKAILKSKNISDTNRQIQELFRFLLGGI